MGGNATVESQGPGLPAAGDTSQTGRLLAAARALHASLDLPRVLERILDEAVAALRAERGFCIRYTPDGFEVAAARYMDRETILRAGRRLSRTLLSRVRDGRRPVVLADAQEAPDLSDAASVQTEKLRAVLAFPLADADGAVLGAIVLDNRFREGAFTDADVAFAAEFAGHAALAVRNARVVDELRARTAALEAANAEVGRLKAALEEKVAAQAAELDRSRELLAGRFRFGDLVGRSPAMAKVVDLLRKVAPTDFRVLIQGESGTGKELAARALHGAGARRARPFVSLNCATLPESLLAAELFGAVKGAYTGADIERPGLFVQADGGTLFLDEVATMRPEMQESLLRVLQEGEVRPLGGSRSRKVDVRVLAASNEPLDRRVGEGRFRRDLYFRLNAVTVLLPALRDRREDIPLLAEHFLAAAAREGKTAPRRLSPEALAVLVAHPWPGNVRELENVMRTAAALAEGPAIGAGEVRARLAPSPVAAGTGAPEGGGALKSIDEHIRDMVVAWGAAMNEADLAQRLGISRKTLWEKRKKFNL